MKKFAFLLHLVALVLLCATAAFCLVDINTASQKELEALPGIGKVYAQRIIENRPYRNINDLKRLKGLKGKTFEKFKNLITVGTPKREAAAAEMVQGTGAVPIYSLKSCMLAECHRCKNMFRISSQLNSGWCPYCGAGWRIKEAAAIPPAPPPQPEAIAPKKEAIPSKAEAVPGAISFEDAANYVGRTKTVSGTVAGTHVSSRSGNLYLNFHQDYRNYLSVKIPESARGRFRRDAESYYNGKKITANGEIRRENGGRYLRIIVQDPAKLKVVE